MSKLRPTPAFMKRLEFLSSGRLYLKDAVKSITFSYTIRGEGSSGIRWARERERNLPVWPRLCTERGDGELTSPHRNCNFYLGKCVVSL